MRLVLERRTTAIKLEGRVALITGAGSGIGKATALAFACEGADIAVNDIVLGAAESTAEAVRKLGRRAVALKADVAEAGEVDAMVERALRELGKIDILVNNAGIAGEFVPTIEQSVEYWDRVVAVHLRGTYLCSRRVGRWLVGQRSGSVLNIASIVGFGGFPMRTSYGPAKAGIINITQALAIEWAPYNIRVNAIAPSYVRTPLVEACIKDGSIDPGPLVKRTPLGMLGAPEDIARAALFLVSDDASFITGVVLPVDGGWLAYEYV